MRIVNMLDRALYRYIMESDDPALRIAIIVLLTCFLLSYAALYIA